VVFRPIRGQPIAEQIVLATPGAGLAGSFTGVKKRIVLLKKRRWVGVVILVTHQPIGRRVHLGIGIGSVDADDCWSKLVSLRSIHLLFGISTESQDERGTFARVDGCAQAARDGLR
jgi:hypothetical protein